MVSVYYKYPVPEIKIGSSLFKWNYLPKQNLFLSFLFHLWNIQQILNIFKKKKIVIANVFPKLQSVKDLLRPLSNKRCFRASFDNQHVKVSQTIVESPWYNFYHIFLSLWGEIISKIYPLWKFEIWLAMTSILLRIVRTCGSRFKSNFLKNKNIFLNFLFHLWNTQ